MYAQHYVDEEEDLETNADARMADNQGSHGGNSSWLRSMVRRNTQISPDGGQYSYEKYHDVPRQDMHFVWFSM